MQKSATVKSEKAETYFSTAVSNDAALVSGASAEVENQEQNAVESANND